MQTYGEAGEPDRECGDDQERQRDVASGEAPPIVRSDLTQLAIAVAGASVPVASAIATGR